MQKYTSEDLAKFEQDENGYIICPAGDYTAIKDFPARCSFGEWCHFDEWCSFGKECSFGEWCIFGEHCSFGEWCSFGWCCGFGARCIFCEWCGFGERCRFSEECSFGAQCSFGARCSFGEMCQCEGGHEFTRLFTVGYIGSRNGTTQFWLLTDGSILVRCGCFCGSLDEFAAKVKTIHGDSKHARAYAAAVELAKIQLGE